MRILLLNQYYPPDFAPTGVMLKALADQLVRCGHTVSVLCASGGYAGGNGPAQSEKDGGAGGTDVTLIRVPSLTSGRGNHLKKFLSYLSYYCGVLWKLTWMRADLVVALTTPPYLSLLARALTKLRGGQHAHWVMDLYPDVMVAHGMLREKGICHRSLRAMTRWGFGGKRCAGVIGLGPDMAEKLRRYLPSGRTAQWVPLWGTAGESANDATVASLRSLRGWKPGEVVFLYSGNMGLGHRFSEVIAAARQLEGQPFRLAFYGDGKRRKEIAEALQEWTGGPHSLEGYVGQGVLAAHLASGDVHLASLEPAWDGTMLPSKLQGIFAAGRPVLFTGSRTGSIGRWILESRAGWVCGPGDIEAHVAAMLEALDPAVRARMGAAALAFARDHFSKETNVARLVAIIEGPLR